MLIKNSLSWETFKKRHISIGVFVVYIDTRSPVPYIPSKSCGLVDEKLKKIWRNGNDLTQLQAYCNSNPRFNLLHASFCCGWKRMFLLKKQERSECDYIILFTFMG